MSGFFRSCMAGLVGLVCALIIAQPTSAAELKEATVTRIIKDVQLLPTGGAAKAASLNDDVRDGTAVRTGTESRSELTFTDQTLARLGSNTIFSFNEGTRNIDLSGGAMLLRVPKGAGGARISTAAVTAAITGTTVIMEYHPGKPVAGQENASEKRHGLPFGFLNRRTKTPATHGGHVKFITLEGVARVYLNNRIGESVLVPAGQMLILTPDAKRMPDPVDVDLDRLLKTSALIVDFPPLASEQLMAEEVRKQRKKKQEGKLIDTNLVIYGRGTLVALVDPPPLDPIDQFIATLGLPGTGGLGSEFGPLKTITSPNPYVINSGTTIMTAPTITTNGNKQQGKIYQGNVGAEGHPADYYFGSHSTFDNVSGFDEHFLQPSEVPMAAFRFSNLQLAGDPTIIVPAGGATNLALISEGQITDAVGGGELTFSGMNSVLIATESAPISFDSNISFGAIPELTIYARGTGSNLTMGAQVLNAGTVSLLSEGSITVNANESVTGFSADANTDYLGGTGNITANFVAIGAVGVLDFTSRNFSAPFGVAPSLSLASDQTTGTINLDVRTDHTFLSNASLVDVRAGTINVTADPGGTSIVFNDIGTVFFGAGPGGIQASTTQFLQTSNSMQFTSGGDIVVDEIGGADSIAASGSIHATTALIANSIFAGSDITSGGDLTAISQVSAGGAISVTNTLLSPSASAVGNITAGHVEVQNINPFSTTSSTTLTAGANGITPFISASGSGLQHTFNVFTVVSPDGIDFSGSHFGPGSDGGLLTINADNQTIGNGGIDGINFDGAAFTVSTAAGNGGTFNLNTVNGLTVDGTTMTASSGIIASDAPAPQGAGGTVNLTSTKGTVTVNNSTIKVSSSDPAGTANRQSSASGGNINIQSAIPDDVAINITSSSQLLSLLENAAPGPGGLITIKATGTMSSISAGGTIEADKGGVDIRNTADLGTVTVSNMNIRGDIIKIAALGNLGVLTIGSGTISADSILKLYAPATNGEIHFVSDCSIGGKTMTVIDAGSVTISNGVTVTVTGAKADVYVNFSSGSPVGAHYMNWGGDNSTTGTFGGLGANDPKPTSTAPPLGAPGQ